MDVTQKGWQPTPRMILADRQSEENLWLALAEQKDEMCSSLEHGLDVSYNCGPGYNVHLVQPSTRDRVARGLFWAAGASLPLSLVGLSTGHEMLAVGFAFSALGGLVAGMVVGFDQAQPSEESWRRETQAEISHLRRERDELRKGAERVHAESADLRMACGTQGTKAAIDVSEENVTLGAVRLKRKNSQGVGAV